MTGHYGATGAARPQGSKAPAATGSAQIEDLQAQARYHRARYDLYRAKMYGPRPTRMARFRELERAYQGAEARLQFAKREPASHNRD
jgi:hypothetical protein